MQLSHLLFFRMSCLQDAHIIGRVCGKLPRTGSTRERPMSTVFRGEVGEYNCDLKSGFTLQHKADIVSLSF